MNRGSKPKPLPEHGTYARFVGRPHGGVAGCRCAPCAEAGRRYCARRYVLNATGRELTVPAAAAAAHLRFLFASGAGWNEVVAVSGCSSSTVHAILGGRPMIHRRTEQRLMAVRLTEVTNAERLVPAVGTVRRAQALVAIGHTVLEIAAAAGTGRTLLTDVLAGSVEQVRARTHEAVAAAFSRLAMTPGSSSRSVARARLAGWAPPLAWDDIDDPASVPQYGEAVVRDLALIEDTAELAAQGLSREAITGRTGAAWSYITKAHSRQGVPLPQIAA